MTDYSNLGLDIQLRPLNSPITSYGAGKINGMEYDYNLDRASITTTQVRSISADRVAAGTVIVGLNLGTSSAGYVLLDGENNRIIVNDGTTNRIVIGNV